MMPNSPNRPLTPLERAAEASIREFQTEQEHRAMLEEAHRMTLHAPAELIRELWKIGRIRIDS